ncbi:MAG: Ig-like domain-containing protein [Methylococcaceae bacterium]|nr:Ig-like domain-containing protein [Methylococcaceae bacterium]
MKTVNEVNNTDIDTMTEINQMNKNTLSRREGSARLRRSIQIALAGSMLASSMAGAVLRDHGPANTGNFFPNWYRDNNGLAIGQCLSTDDAGNGPLCLLAGTNPAGFAGNFGDEGFYSTADVVIPLTGGTFTWMAHLEMAYATGAPPAVRVATDPQEIVFARERMLFDVPVTPDNSCEGHYTIRTPIRVHEFDLPEGRRTLFFTDDIAPVAGVFTAALKGHTGPFFTWDVGEDGINPVSALNPAVTIPSLVPGLPDRKYVGDPNVEHLFVGSTLPAGPGHEDKIFNNYVEIIPPVACDLGGGAGVPAFWDQAGISGPIWDAPIADPVAITKATFTRSLAGAGLDVWAEATSNQNLTLTASTDGSQHLPSVTLKEETVTGAKTGLYHAHLDFDGTQTLPSQVTVVNLTSVPASRDSASIVDSVVVTKATFDPASKVLCIAAHSGDEVAPSTLTLASPYTGTLVATSASCTGVATNDVVLGLDLNGFSPDTRFVPQNVIVQSSRGGSETAQPVVGTGASDATVVNQTVADIFSVNGTGLSPLDLIANDTNTADTRLVIVSQPEVGTVTAPATGGTATYQAVEGMDTSVQTFFYALQDNVSKSVSNVSKVTLNVTRVIPPPVAVTDQQGVFRTSLGSNINVLGNDLTGLSATPIDPASVQIASQGTRGTATVNPDGTIRYVPVGQGGAANNTIDTLTYTVANTAGSRSGPITVQVVLKSAAEAVAFQRVRYNGTWNIRFTSTYAGAAGAVNLAPVATCEVSANPGAPTRVGVIGTASPGAGTNAYVIGGANPVPSGNNWTVRCTTTSGGTASRTGTL